MIDIDRIQNKQIGKIEKNYIANKTDQPKSTITIYTKKNKYYFDDYGLEGDKPLE